MNADYSSANHGRTLAIHILLKSDTTLGRGDGISGVVDAEVEHDANGLPFLRGRTLKGLLNEECANLLYALQSTSLDQLYQPSAMRLFGGPGSDRQSAGCVHYGDAVLPAAVRRVVDFELSIAAAEKKLAERGPRVRAPRREPALQASDILQALTSIRRQTALDEMGVPLPASLRAMRVVLRETPLIAPLIYHPPSTLPAKAIDQDLALLAATIKALRRIGTGRNRGRGRVVATLHSADHQELTDQYMSLFAQSLGISTAEGGQA